ncbi:MAG TPA: HlyD family secretion protein, partial [Novosphingobium sp.]|nr:HlyD family secretion protein [Novosphingobium sp.]
GAILARIDPRDYRLKVAQAQGALAVAEAGLAAATARIANLDARAQQQRSTIAQNAAAVTARQAEAQLATQQAERQAHLARQQVTSEEKLQSAQADRRKAAAGWTQARAALAAARAQVQVLATERAAAIAAAAGARGALQQARAGLAAARLDLERTAIRAPVSGIVGQRALRLGQYADIGMPLLALVPMAPYVVANYKETQIDRIRPGQPVTVAVDALGGAVLTGRVDSFAPASGAQFALLPPDNATGNFTKIVQRMPLRIRLDAGQARLGALRPGMSVETSVDTRP